VFKHELKKQAGFFLDNVWTTPDHRVATLRAARHREVNFYAESSLKLKTLY